MKVVVVIPAYNEEKMIGTVVTELRNAYPHVLVVDDGSTDRTAEVARSAGATVHQHVVNRGQGAALQTGIRGALLSGAEIIVTFDADGQMLAEEITILTKPLIDRRCDVVLGSRFLEKPATDIPFARKLLLKAGLLFTKITTGLNLTDTHNGLRAFSKDAALKISIECDRMAHASELLEQIASHKLRYREAPVTVRYTAYSLGKGQKISGAYRILRDLVVSSWIK